MKKLKILLEKPWFAYTFAACAAVLLFTVLNNFHSVAHYFNSFLKLISPIIIGLAVAYLLNPIALFFENKPLKKIKKASSRHLAAVALTAVCFILVIALLLVALIPSLVQSVTKLVNNWPSYTVKLEELLNKAAVLAENLKLNIDITNLSGMIDSAMDKGIALLKENTNTIMSTLGSVGTSISNFFIGILFGFCFLAAKKTLLSFATALRTAIYKEKRLERNNELLHRCNKVFLRYVGYTLIDALIIGVTTLIFLLVMRMPYAPLIAIVVAITNIIPTFGPIIGGAIGIFFLVLDKPLNALLFLIFICVLQALDGAVIKPRLFSGSLGIPGVWTLILIIFGGKIAGVLGILLAIPFAAIFVILYQETVVPRLEKRKETINKNSSDA